MLPPEAKLCCLISNFTHLDSMLSRASKQGLALLSSSCREVSIPSLISSTHGGSRSFASSHADVHSTTVLCVRKDGEVVLVADGQVTMGGTVVKPNVKKTRKIGEQAVGGFAGATADAFTLFERLETKLEEHPGQLTRAAVELAKMWRMDKYLRRLDVCTWRGNIYYYQSAYYN
jgi:Proteasome subunit